MSWLLTGDAEPVLAEAIVAHLAGDFLLQNDFLAKGKKERSWICLIHVLIWGMCLLLLTKMSIEQVAAVTILHFLQDRWSFIAWYMRKMHQDAFAKPPLGPWSIIVVDQVFHLLTIMLAIRFI